MKAVLLFPGQGAQRVGMGRELASAFPAVKRRLEMASEALGLDLSSLCFRGPRSRLNATENAQPAIFALSIGIFDVLAEYGVKPECAAGHSLGELTALTAAGALDFDTGLSLVRKRGLLMAEACQANPGAMAVIEGASLDRVEQLIETSGNRVWIANINAPGQVVISGGVEAVDALAAVARSESLKCAQLALSGAFHTPLMADAAENFAALVDSVTLRKPHFPVIGNRKPMPLTEVDAIRAELHGQMRSPVRWTDAMSRIREIPDALLIEVGPGKVLKGLMLRITRNARVRITDGARDLRAVLRELGQV